MLPTTLLHFKSKTTITNFNDGYLSKINGVEDLLRALVLVLPGRVNDGDLCSQAILTVLNLVSLANTNLLYKSANKKKLFAAALKQHDKDLKEKNHHHHHQQEEDDDDEEENESFLFNQSLHLQSRTNKLYRYSATLLSVVSYSEILLEMIIARKWDTKKKWQFISCIEGFKMLLRLILFYTNNKKMILHPTHYIRNINPENLEFDNEEKFELTHLDPRIGLPSSANETLYENQQQDYMDSSSSILTPTLKKINQLAELLWIIRPFIYVILLKRAQSINEISKDDKDNDNIEKDDDNKEEDDDDNDDDNELEEKDEENYWQPWIISFIIDISSFMMKSISLDGPLEKEEHKRRFYLLLYYFFRGPLYSRYTSKLLDWVCDATEHRPLISILTTAINDYKPFWQQCYFYTSGS